MKKCFTFLLILLLSGCLQAQTWEEWTSQKKTQIKYLLEQIVALSAYGKQLKQGYDIVQQGLSTIHSIKQGDFKLHDQFFSSLKSVNPNVSRYTKVAGIIFLQANIIKQIKASIKTARSGGQLSKDELQYLDKVINGLFGQCATLIDELNTVIMGDQLQLSDDERIGCIDVLYREMQEHYLFAQKFQREVAILSVQRIRESKDIGQMRSVYGIK